MKKLLFLLFLIPLLSAGSANSVYICTGKYSKKYHSHICEGMKNCKAETKTITLQQAKAKNLIKCGYCYGR